MEERNVKIVRDPPEVLSKLNSIIQKYSMWRGLMKMDGSEIS